MIENPVVEAVAASARVEPAHKPKRTLSAGQDDRAFLHLAQAIKTAEAAVEQAQRGIAMYANKPSNAAAAVMHALTWGLANASSSIETAMSCIEDAHIVRRMEAADALARLLIESQESIGGDWRERRDALLAELKAGKA